MSKAPESDRNLVVSPQRLLKDESIRTPYGTENKLDARVSLLLYGYRDGCLGDKNASQVVHNGDGGDFDAVYKLEDEHGREHLRANDQNIAHGDDGSLNKRIMEAAATKRNTANSN